MDNVCHQVGFIVRISRVTFKLLWNFSVMGYQFPVYEMSLLPGVFFQQLLLKIQNHIDQELKTALLIQESLRRVLAEISWDTFENYKRLQHRCFSVNIAKFSRRWLLLNFFIESQKETVFTTNSSVMRTLNVLSQLILHLICQYDAQNVQHSQKQFFFSVDFLVVIIIYRYFLLVYL